MRKFIRAGCIIALALAVPLMTSACGAGGSNSGSDGSAQAEKAGPSITDPDDIQVNEEGWGDVRLGATEAAVRDVLGRSDSQQEFPEMSGQPAVVFYDYRDKGIQISFLKPDMTVKALFFFGGTGDHAEFARFASGTDRGITWASTPEDVLAEYGDPINDFKSDDGGLEWRRLVYDTISFRFQNGALETIAVGSD